MDEVHVLFMHAELSKWIQIEQPEFEIGDSVCQQITRFIGTPETDSRIKFFFGNEFAAGYHPLNILHIGINRFKRNMHVRFIDISVLAAADASCIPVQWQIML
ncbi:hypothetical protein SDC9_98156 [bioreactor metagenome]|uniref:Uncharacterized protein n=1 Tax=bioreactor metagenome TaxID=1076179 RepID=A0A645AFC2_9ZZZZ